MPSRLFDAVCAAAGVIALATTLLASLTFTREPGVAANLNTARLSMAWYAAALVGMTGLRGADWKGESRSARSARWCWTWGWVSLVVHVLTAFHFVHHWSHAQAFEHTRKVGGVGEGLYVNEAVMAVWGADVVMWWLFPKRYSLRPAIVDWLVHAFLFFIAFNASVVFASGPTRWIGLGVSLMLAVRWFRHRAA